MTKAVDVSVFIIVVAFLCTSSMIADARSSRGRMEGNTYIAPLGDFRCEIRGFEYGDVKRNDRFGPKGGSAAFIDFFTIRRVDVERFEEPVAPAQLDQRMHEMLHAWYFEQQLLPLVKQGVKNPIVLQRSMYLKDPPAYLSIMRLPATRKKNEDVYRAAMQYTDGNFMYTISVSREVSSGGDNPEAEKIDDLIRTTKDLFDNCRFPAMPATPDKG